MKIERKFYILSAILIVLLEPLLACSTQSSPQGAGLENMTWQLQSYGETGNLRTVLNGPEFTAKAIRKWLSRIGVKTLFIEPGSPWENGYIESFNGKLRDELLNREIFTTLEEARVLIEQWRQEYNHIRPHSSLRYRPPAPEAIVSEIVT